MDANSVTLGGIPEIHPAGQVALESDGRPPIDAAAMASAVNEDLASPNTSTPAAAQNSDARGDQPPPRLTTAIFVRVTVAERQAIADQAAADRLSMQNWARQRLGLALPSRPRKGYRRHSGR